MAKVGIVGSGFVGATAGYALVMQGVGREIVLVDKNAARAAAEADDIRHAVPFAHPLDVRAAATRTWPAADVVVLCAGVGQKPGETRLATAAAQCRGLSRGRARGAEAAPRMRSWSWPPTPWT